MRMIGVLRLVLVFSVALLWHSAANAWMQEPTQEPAEAGAAAPAAVQKDAPTDQKDASPKDALSKKIGETAEDVASKVTEVAKSVNASQQAKDVTAGVLNPIYKLAEYFSFSAFHWLAFALMVAGVVSYAGQLVLGKLVMLAHLHISVMEVLSDGLGLAISLVGLVLTTQAAAENSAFTTSPAAVLSATLVGAVCGFFCYVWGQSQEIKALQAERAQKKPAGSPQKR